ncbi:MAG TPA: ABC transporter permease [Candidatus Acidoferrales bacterium]|nr:ABC transporter permease [Candidatus Acidoferrales bacterium]
MGTLGELWRRLAMLFRREKFDRDMDEEMRLHLELREKEQATGGFSSAEAHMNARKHFGNALAFREASHDSWGWAWLEHLLQDLKFAFRMLRKSPVFTVTAVLTLALGIGANTAVFSVIDGVFLRPLPYPQPSRLVYPLWVGNREVDDSIGAADYLFWKEHSHVFESAGAYEPVSGSNLVAGQSARFVHVTRVSPGLFRTLGIQPTFGRDFTREEGQPVGPHAAILSYDLWKSLFPPGARATGQVVQLDGKDYSVVGVMPRGFQFVAAADVYTPLQLTFNPDDHDQNYGMVARLRPNVSFEQAQADTSQVFDLFKQIYPAAVWQGWRGLSLISYRQELTGNVRTPLLVLYGAVSLVLLIAISNVISLFLGRASSRQTEVALRVTIGASRWRILRQLATEGIVLACLGGGLGLLSAGWSLRSLVAFIPQSVSIDLSTSLLPLAGQVKMDTAVLLFTLLLSLFAGIAAGFFPYLQVRKAKLYEELKQGGRNAGLNLRHPRVRNILVTAEIAISVVLFVGAGLLTESFLKLRTVDPGFRPQGLWALQMSLPPQKYTTTAQAWTLQQRIIHYLKTLPGVTGVATSSNLPVERGLRYPYDIPGCGRLMVQARAISPSYFEVMRIPLLSGREFLDTDKANVVIVNSELARQCWPGRSPMGREIGGKESGASAARAQVIGVVGDTQEGSLDSPPMPVVYLPQWSVSDQFTEMVHGWFLSAWVIRSRIPLNFKAVAQAVDAADPTLPVAHFEPMSAFIAGSFAVSTSRLLTVLVDGFTGLALMLALIGIYGLLSYLVTQLSREIGIRMALGALKSDVLAMVLGRGLRLALIGLAIGIASALAFTRLLANLLFDVKPTDPLTFVVVSSAVIGVVLSACYIPARRASRVDPMVVLRHE